MIPESRKEQGLLLGRPVTENVSLASLARVAVGGFVKAGAERRTVRDVLARVDVGVAAARRRRRLVPSQNNLSPAQSWHVCI
jgi:ABC-type sugar transport system ATPase subunit